MLDKTGFDQWAEGYDRSVEESEAAEQYPFAGYQRVLETICRRVREGEGKAVLDLGVGTGELSRRLYEQGCQITGVDFSAQMLEAAREKMPGAELLQADFSRGLPPELAGRRFDFILCTYAIHHLDGGQKLRLIRSALDHLPDGGMLLIGDGACATREELEACRARCGGAWDPDECYPVAEELRAAFPGLEFEPISFCSGVLTLKKAPDGKS